MLNPLLFGQEPAKPAPAEPPKPEKKSTYTALIGGDVYTVTQGVMKGGTVLLKDDKIFKIGTSLDLPEGTTKIDVTGKRVLPGFVAVAAHGLGLSGAPGKMADALDPFGESIKLALAGGITSALVEAGGSGGGLFGGGASSSAGPGAVIKMSYGTLEGMMVSEPASLSLAGWMNGTASERYDLRDTLMKARAHLEKERDFEKRRAEGKLKTGETAPNAGALQPFVKLLKGEVIGRLSASRSDEIRHALDLVAEFKFKAVLTDVVEGWTMADEIGRAHAYCVVTPRTKEHAARGATRPSGSSIEQAAILRKAGVKFAILPPSAGVGTGGIAGRDLLTLPLEAAFAIRGGLDETTALEAITITAAEMCGVDTRIGSIEEGKDADLVVTEGDPFDYRTFVEMTFVNGKLLYERSKSPWFSHLKGRK